MGLDRSDHLRERHGANVVWLPFDLHPEIPDEGIDATASERRRTYREHLRSVAAAAGLEYAPADRVPRTRQALEAAEWVRQHRPDSFEAFHVGLFRAYWAQTRDIGRRTVVLEVAAEAGLDATEIAAALDAHSASDDVDASTRAAIDAGVTGTPAWLIAGRLLIPGAQPVETFDRVIERMRPRGSLT